MLPWSAPTFSRAVSYSCSPAASRASCLPPCCSIRRSCLPDPVPPTLVKFHFKAAVPAKFVASDDDHLIRLDELPRLGLHALPPSLTLARLRWSPLRPRVGRAEACVPHRRDRELGVGVGGQLSRSLGAHLTGRTTSTFSDISTSAPSGAAQSAHRSRMRVATVSRHVGLEMRRFAETASSAAPQTLFGDRQRLPR